MFSTNNNNILKCINRMLESLKNVTAASTDPNVLTKSKNIAAIKVTGGKNSTPINNNGRVKFSIPNTGNRGNLEELILGSDDESDVAESILEVSSLFLRLF